MVGGLVLCLTPVALASPPGEPETRQALDRFLEQQGLWVDGCWQPRARARFDHLIATVPDPVDSEFSREFDLTAGALRRGLEDHGYVLDSHALPWRTDARPTGRHRQEPGLLFFRRSDGTTVRARAVFLVGESPTSGIHDAALRQALDEVARLTAAADRTADWRCPAPARQAVEFKVLAPFFSGSRHALRTSLERWLKANDGTSARFKMISGTATSPDNKAVLEDTRNWQESQVIDFASAATNDACLIGEALRFLRGRLAIDPPDPTVAGLLGREGGHDIAILAESSTYGSFFENLPDASGRILVLPFPMHISHLRSALDERRKSERKQQGTSADSSFFSLGDQRRGAAAFPLFAPKPTAQTLELALATIVRTITQQKVQAVGIIASNVRDKLYLAEIVRRHAPDVRLFTTEGDLLLAHPDFREGSRGMVVASSRSLRQPDPIQQAITGSRSIELRFASDQTQGVFEAARALVSEGGATLRTPPLTDQPCADDEEVWISVIGNGDLWPIELRGSRAGESGGLTLPRGWLVLFYFACGCVLGIYVILWLYFAREGSDREGENVTFWQQWLRPEGASSGPRGRARQLFLCLLAILIACPTFVIAWPVLESASGWLAAAAGLLLSVLGVTLFGLLMTLGWRTFRDWRDLDEGQVSLSTIAVFAPFLTALGMTLGLVLWALEIALGPRSDKVSILLLERSVAISSGVSPLLPIVLILAVPVLWLLMSLSRHRALSNLPFLGRHPNGGAASGRGAGTRLTGVDLKRLVDRVCLVIDPSNFFQPWRLALVVTGFLVAPFCYLMFFHQVPELRIVRSLEAYAFDRFMSLGIGLAILLVLGALWRFGMGWRALSRLTDGLKNLRFDPSSSDKEPRWWADNRDRIPAMVSATPGISLALRQRWFRGVKVSRPATQLDTLEIKLQDLFADHEDTPRPSELAEVWEHVMEFLAERGHRIEARADAPNPEPERQPGQHERPSDGASDDDEDPVLAQARSFFAMETAFFVSRAVAQLRQLLTFSTVGLVLILLTVSIYPFEPQRILFLYVWSLIATTAAIGLLVLFQMERDEVISWISGTEPRKVGWDRGFIVRFVSYAGLPILALLANQFPQIRDVLFQWVEPITKLFL